MEKEKKVEVDQEILKRQVCVDRWKDLCVEHQGILFRAALGLTNGNVFRAGGVVNDLSAHILDRAPDVNVIRDVPGFLCFVMRNLYRTKRKKENEENMISTEAPRGEGHVEGDFLADSRLSVLDQIQQEEERRILWAEIYRNLSGRELKLFKLRLEDYSSLQIAEILGEEQEVIAHDLKNIYNKFTQKVKRNLKAGKINQADVSRTSA